VELEGNLHSFIYKEKRGKMLKMIKENHNKEYLIKFYMGNKCWKADKKYCTD